MQPRRIAAAILVLGWLAMLAITAPGYLTYDSVTQLASARSGFYNSWHPPVMAWLLGVFDGLVPGTLLFLVFQTGLLLAALLALLWTAPRNWLSAVLALVIVALPQWLLFQGEIWKDILFADTAIAGFAALALLGVRWRLAWLLAAQLLLSLAAATRQTGFVLLPVAAVTLAAIAHRHGRSRWIGAGFLAAALLLVVATNLVLARRGDGGEGAAAQLQTGQAYDLAGALARQPGVALSLAPPLKTGLTRAASLYSPLRVDTMAGDPKVSTALEDSAPGEVARAWRGLILGHPGLYLAVRWADFRAVLLTPDAMACHFAPVGVDGDPAMLKALGIARGIRPRDHALAAYARGFFATPVYSHPAWAILALVLLVLLLRRGANADLAVAGLMASALLFAASFAVFSIACDYRYLLFLDLSAAAGAIYLFGTKPRLAKAKALMVQRLVTNICASDAERLAGGAVLVCAQANNKKILMRAAFLGQNVFALGYGVATLQSPPLVIDEQTGQPYEPGDLGAQTVRAQADAGAAAEIFKPL